MNLCTSNGFPRLDFHIGQQAAGKTPLHGGIVSAHLHVQVHVCAGARAREDGLGQAEFLLGGVDKVGLGRAVVAACAFDVAAGCVGAVHGEALCVAGAGGGVFALCAVDEGDVEPDEVVGDGVLELGVCAGDEAVGLADFEGCAGGAEGLRVEGARGDVDGA